MAKAEPAMASSEVVEERKRSAEKKSAEQGHKIGNWRIKKEDGRDIWHGPCLNPYCRARVTLNLTASHGVSGLTAFETQCPWR